MLLYPLRTDALNPFRPLLETVSWFQRPELFDVRVSGPMDFLDLVLSEEDYKVSGDRR